MKFDQNKSVKTNDDALVQRLYIAAPCDVPWDSMEGDERTRFCGQCKLNVYNVSQMSSKEVAEVFRKSQGNACLQLFRRKDGTILTENCPVGLRRIRDRLKTLKRTAAIALVWLGAASTAQAQMPQTSDEDMRHFYWRGKSAIVPAHASPSNLQTSTSAKRPTYRTDAFTVCTEKKPAESFLNLKLVLALFYSSVLSVFGTFFLVIVKRSRISTIGTMLLAIWALTGFLLGILSISK